MQKLMNFVRNVLTPLVVLLTCGLVIYDRLVSMPPVGPSMVVDGVSLGRAFGPAVTSTLADAWHAAANTLEQGKSVSDAQVALQTTWQEGRVKAFNARVAPEFARVLAEGSEPSDSARRAEVVKLWRDFANGLKGGR